MTRAASGTYRNVDSALETLAGLTSTARRTAFGTNSCRRPSRLAAISTLKILMPVALPPGRARLATRPSLTGSSPTPKTIGIVAVATLAASDAGLLPGVAITATRRRTRSAIGAPDAVKKLATRSNAGVLTFPELGPTGGTMLGVPVLASDGVPAGQLVLMDAAQFAAGDEGIELASSGDAMIGLDTAPTGSTPLTSLFQQNMTAVKASRYFAIQALTTTGVAYITGIS